MSETAAARRPSLAATHSNYSPDWWTPLEWLAWVEATFGTDDWHDPCPADWLPNEASGLTIRWEDPCYVNHPGARRSTAAWWAKYLAQRAHLPRFIWAAFNVEQFRHMLPSALEQPGWLVLPRTRVAWIWGGPDREKTATSGARIHGRPMTQPGNWSGFWSTVEPARPPVDSIILRTGDR